MRVTEYHQIQPLGAIGAQEIGPFRQSVFAMTKASDLPHLPANAFAPGAPAPADEGPSQGVILAGAIGFLIVAGSVAYAIHKHKSKGKRRRRRR